MDHFRRASRILTAVCVFFLARTAAAHLPLYGVGTSARLIFKEDKVLITFDLSYDGVWAQGEMLAADTDKSSSVEEGEAIAYQAKQWTEKIAPRLKARWNGTEVPIRKAAERHENLVGEIYGVPFELFYELEVPAPGEKAAPGATQVFELVDTVTRDETPARPLYLVPLDGHGSSAGVRFRCEFEEPQRQPPIDPVTLSYVLDGPKLIVRFDFAPATAASSAADSSARFGPGAAAGAGLFPPGTKPEFTRAPSQKASKHVEPGPESDPSSALVTPIKDFHQLTRAQMLFWILVAVFYGAAHALAPGHGKAMVAAYLIGTRGKVRDAVVLGTVTTITHTGSVFLFGIAIFLLVNAGAETSEGALRNRVIVGTQLGSGILLLGMGLILFRRWLRRGTGEGHGHGHSHGHRHGHSHSHDHSQDHDHSHGHSHDHSLSQDPSHAQGDAHGHSHGPGHGHHHSHDHGLGLLRGGRPRMWDLISLGFSGGIVPCPAGLTVILLSLQEPSRLLFALGLLVFFSLGLGSVLVAIGVLLITGKALAGGRAKEGAFFQEMEFLRRIFAPTFLATLDRAGFRLLQVLPAFSALFISGMGAFFCVMTILKGRTELQAMWRLISPS